MSNLILAAGGDDGYQISRSVRLRSSASAYFNRTPVSAGNRKTWTWSAWVKRGKLGVYSALFSDANGAGSGDEIGFRDNDVLQLATNGGTQIWLVTSQVFRDPSAWYHIVATVDTTQATASNRAKLYVNGVQVTAFGTATYPSQNADTTNFNTATQHLIGGGYVSLDGYLTEINFIDGQALTPSSFGETDTLTGVWKAKKYAGTYGTNGFYLNFSDNSAATAAAIGKDSSGNGNNWTPNNISVTAGVTYDSMLDVPTMWADGGNGRGNYATMNPLNAASGLTSSDGNLKIAASASVSKFINSSISLPSSGAYYIEITFGNASSPSTGQSIGIAAASRSLTAANSAAGAYLFYASTSGALISNTTVLASGLTAIAANEVFQIAVDVTNSKMWIGRSNVWYNATGGTTGNPSTGANAGFTASFADYFIYSGFDTTVAVSANLNFGQRPFTYTPPTGFLALNTQNLPAVTINNGAQYMAASLWTATGTTQTITNGANNNISTTFQPDLVWNKPRNSAFNHTLNDSVRGSQYYLSSNLTNAEATDANYVTAFTSSGFSLGTSNYTNGTTVVAWQWKAGGTAVSNTSGSITSSVSANTTAGFSVATFTAQASGTGTFGHGLGVAPSMVIVKQRASAGSWGVYHISVGNGSRLLLDSTAASVVASSYWNNTSPTSTVVTLGSGFATAGTMVAYCFAAVKGYSAFGSYTGNGSTDGTFVYCGFRPRWLLLKNTGGAASWYCLDSSRNTYNVVDAVLVPNSSQAEVAITSVDFLSNGFKLRTTTTDINGSGTTYIYAAFAENPFKNSLAR